MTKPFWKSRTVILAIAQALVGVLVVINTQDPTLGLAGLVAIVKSGLDVYIRMTTVE